LAERFKLAVRRESRQQPVYVLTVEKSGPKIKPHQEGVAIPDGMPIRPGDRGDVIFTGVEMRRLAWFLGTRLERPVIDRTGLPDRYDFNLGWDIPGDPAPDPTRPTVFSALHDLGLKLETEKGPVEYLTIERLERPTEN
jgi:uncharacterized protein (TIGR03435 family)